MGYIHLGADISVHDKDIIGIFDIEKTTVVKSVNDFLSAAQKSGNIYYCSLDMPKSFLVVNKTIMITNVSAGIIKKRCIMSSH